MAETRGIRWSWGIAAAIFLAVFFVPVRLAGVDSALRERLMDAGHLPAFVGITLYLFRQWPGKWSRNRRLLAAFLTSVFLGVSVEYFQEWSGRQASLTDAINGITGAFVALLAVGMWPRGVGARFVFVLYAAWVCASAVLPAWRIWGGICRREEAFPVLADFEERGEFRLWLATIPHDNPVASNLTPSTNGVSHGAQAARVSIEAHPEYPAIRLFLNDQDWRGYRVLAFDVFNPADPFVLAVRIDDNFPVRSYNDRYNGAFPLVHGWNRVRIPLVQIQNAARQRSLNLGAIRRIIFFLEQPKVRRVFFLDWIRLE